MNNYIKPLTLQPSIRRPCIHSALLSASTTLRVRSHAQTMVSRSTSSEKELCVQTSDKATLTSAMECGVNSFVFPEEQRALAAEWAKLGRFKALFLNSNNVVDGDGGQVAKVHSVAAPADLKHLEGAFLAAGGGGGKGKMRVASAPAVEALGAIAIMDASDWKVIPAENLVAMAQASAEHANVRLFATADTALEAEVMLGALEVGVHGVLLRTNSSADVRALAKAVETKQLASTPPLNLELATVTEVVPTGMGERVCVDLANMLVPGEGMLVGSFASGLLLVHSECEESEYIASRPFRCNAGAVHQYVASPGGRTAYLCELQSGQEVVVCNPAGRTRRGLVGRSKLETRPLVMVGVRTSDGVHLRVMLQNAETVKLVGPSNSSAPSSSQGPYVDLTASSTMASQLGVRNGGSDEVENGGSSAKVLDSGAAASDVASSTEAEHGDDQAGAARHGGGQGIGVGPAKGGANGTEWGGKQGDQGHAKNSRDWSAATQLEDVQNGTSPERSESSQSGIAQAGRVPGTDSGNSSSLAHSSAGSSSSQARRGDASYNSAKAWRTLSVSSLQPGDQVYVYRPKSAARHMGHAINEYIHEQ